LPEIIVGMLHFQARPRLTRSGDSSFTLDFARFILREGFAARERPQTDRDKHDAAQIAPARANIRFMFHAMVTSFHSPRTFSRPRNRNWRNPSTDLMIPNTGSGVCLRKA
jgi:hypothetical protein